MSEREDRGFVPLQGIDRVLVSAFQRPSDSLTGRTIVGRPSAIFLYGSQSPAITQELSPGLHESEEGWVYGTALCVHEEETKNKMVLAVPTGDPEQVLKGQLLLWPSLLGCPSVALQRELLKFDAMMKYDPDQPTQGSIRRGVVEVVRESGESSSAYWYYQEATCVDTVTLQPTPETAGTTTIAATISATALTEAIGSSDSRANYVIAQGKEIGGVVIATRHPSQDTPGESPAAFKVRRMDYVTEMFAYYNKEVFDGRLPKDLPIEWNKRMQKTAGATYLGHWKGDKWVKIGLSDKLLDTQDKLRQTLVHESIHAAMWLFDGVLSPPHGRLFQTWAKKAMKKCPELNVTTTHEFEVAYKYRWVCQNPECSIVYERVRNTIDVMRHNCGKCQGRLEQIPTGS
eukprot:gb/GEZN01007282.1/.p1 GENE.gb/GEZN01007282.1/~~gb/GEZN01007282.1/.p1  ORF type:complete len:464 (-),score=49.06 gb/GEZN01007282.1/:166-1368(-)